ncbi:hypothetical protein GCM10027063_21980 [Promicromonospora xylanilytica]
MSIGSHMKNDFSLMAMLIIPIAIAVNFVGGSVALALKLPLYLDSIGTFLVAMLAGPVVGALTGFLSLAFVSATDPTSLPWAVQAALVGSVVGWLARRGMFDRVWRIVCCVALVVVLSVVCVITIRMVVFGGFTTNGSSLIAAALVTSGVAMIPAQFVSSFVSELPDKTLSILLAVFVIRSMSDRYLIKFSNGFHFTAAARAERRGRVREEPDLVGEAAQVTTVTGSGSYGTYDRWRGSRSTDGRSALPGPGVERSRDVSHTVEEAR